MSISMSMSTCSRDMDMDIDIDMNIYVDTVMDMGMVTGTDMVTDMDPNIGQRVFNISGPRDLFKIRMPHIRSYKNISPISDIISNSALFSPISDVPLSGSVRIVHHG
jgi:hypothetical protein